MTVLSLAKLLRALYNFFYAFGENTIMVSRRSWILKLYYLVLIIIIFSGSLYPLDPWKSLSDYVINIWDVQRGLPQDEVRRIVQDHKGYIWIATGKGLVRFNGYQFDIFDSSNTREITNDSIITLMVAKDGTLWVGTYGGGVVMFRNDRFTNYNTKNGLMNDFIWSIMEDRQGNIWIGTNGSGLIRLSDNRFKAYTRSDGLSDNVVFTTLEDKQGRIWAGTENGLTLIDGSKYKVYTINDGLGDNVINTIYEDSNGIIWVGTLYGLSMFRNNTFITNTIENGLSSNMVLFVMEDSDGILWVGTDSGLNRMTNGETQYFLKPEALADHSVISLFEDREKNLWVGTLGKGVCVLHSSKFSILDTEDGLSIDYIKAVWGNGSGDLWVGTNGGGLHRIRGDTIENYTLENGLISNYISTVYGDRQGKIWIGTRRGLNLMIGGRIRPFAENQILGNRSITSLFEDSLGCMWIGTSGAGLYKCTPPGLNVSVYNEGISNLFILSIAEDRKGNIWVGTNRGLNMIPAEGGQVKFFSQQAGLPNDMINDIYVDSADAVWIGTHGGGLSRLKGDQFVNFSTQQGLANNVIYRILEDQKGNFWMSSNKGIFMVSKSELNRLATAEKSKLNCLLFHESDGLKSSVCTGNYQPAGWKDKMGNLYFPTIKGLVVIDPERVIFNRLVPPVIIEDVRVGDESVIWQENLVLKAGTSRIEIYFSVLSFAAPEKMKYSYRLEGHQNQWQDGISGNLIRYDNLTGGDYKFRVIASNNDGVWNYSGAGFSFRIRPEFQDTFWFSALLAALLSLLLFWLYKFSEIKLKKLAEARKKYVKSTLIEGKAQVYKHRLLELMDADKPYLNEEISLDSLAEKMQIPKKHLSQVINEQLNQNFKNFINRYRVEAAKIKLLDPKEKDFVLLKIAFDVGFNSKSVFNAAFKKFARMSPSEYRRKYYKSPEKEA